MAKATQVQSKSAVNPRSTDSTRSRLRFENVLLVVIAAALLVSGSVLWQFSTNIKQTTAALQSEVSNITMVLRGVATEVDGLQTSVGHMTSDISHMASNVSHTATEIDRMSAEMSLLATDVQHIQARLDVIEPMILDQAWQLAVPTLAAGAEVNTMLGPEETMTPADQVTTVMYRVRPGDTLWHISHSLLGSPHHHHLISELNDLNPPTLIRPGDRLRIPIAHAE